MTTTDLPRIPREVPDWHARAACQLFPELRDAFHDAKPGTPEHLAARIICAACPVKLECATSALERGEPWGMWGGLDRADRKAIAAQHGYPVPAMVPDHGTDARYKKNGCRCPDCKRAHAVYEFDRRARARAKAQQHGVWNSPLLVLIAPVRTRRGRVLGPGQYLLPLPGIPAPRNAEPEPAEPLALAA